MATKSIVLRPNSLPSTFISRRGLFPKSVLSTTTTSSASVGKLSFSTIAYGPSLSKGHSPNPLKLRNPSSFEDTSTNNNLVQLDVDAFTRVFDISALRVPSDLCFSLESRLRGHLLNWPRIKNIARVPGDEIDDQLKTLFPKSDFGEESDALVTLNRRIYGKAEGDGELLSPVLYRDKLARTFNSRGYVKFRNLAKISRPKKKRKKDGVDSDNCHSREKRVAGRNEMALLEVVTEEDDSEGEDMSSLLGKEFAKKWRGPTRLLLLDERYSNIRTRELPESIKAVLEEHEGRSTMTAFELVKCKLTLFYNYWQQNEILEVLLPKGMTIPSAFETVGHIAHLNLRDEHLPYKNLIAKVVLDKNEPKIQTVVNKIDAIHNDYRTMQLEVLAGNRSLVTTVVENGLRFQVDLAAVYWNSRLATERQRLLSCFTRDDVVCDVFSGVGPIAISAAKKVKHVYANDLNPYAVEYLERNCVLNKLERKIEVFNMDGRRFIETIFAIQRAQSITQVVMNLPNDAAEFLDAFRGIFKRNHMDKQRTLPRIYVYGFSKAHDPEFDFHERIRIALSEVGFEVEMRRVRLVAPGKWMLCASFILPERVAYAKTDSIL
ncbi:tRNA (guanine(37)-N1)-methyltransferase 1 [Olea europaea subsp. europaea]|uniref:tRNA (guanine(37)-N1)-methyltransferase n=1 Tax=Olea europaea subsp. europaea TaxID=158383 RepID=A0A8S0TMC6_OLEEU|nr:tRNA (guanine(37)-N1)-methyltransferase 1 [Olea europaea subsp. europaea]CAA3006896.1 tRNA (guanine(37)-N1)-methyltransferase 1 [Olea europaea subsp. europaea]